MESLSYYNEELVKYCDTFPKETRAEYEKMLHYSKCDASTRTSASYIKTAYLPKLFLRSDIDRLSKDMDLLMGILKKVVDRYFHDESYRKYFQFTEEEERLVLGGRYERCFLPIARFDIFYNDDDKTYKFCELNTDGSSAMNEDRELHIGQKLFSTAYKKFCEKYKTSEYELFDSWVLEVEGIYKNIRNSEKRPTVAIVDYMECATVKEFQIFLEAFEKANIQAFICDVRELRYEDGKLIAPSGQIIDVVYRRAVTSDVLANLESSQALIQAAREDAVLLLGDFHTQIIHNKAMSVMLRHDMTYSFLDENEVEYLKKHFPFTKFYEENDRNLVIDNRTKWVLKPADGYASRGIFVGVECTDEEWKKAVLTIPAEHYILQEYCEPYSTFNYGETPKDEYGKRQYHHLTGLFMYNGKLSGIYSRASIPKTFAKPDDEIALPTLIVEEN